jgi:hypothetical protein
MIWIVCIHWLASAIRTLLKVIPNNSETAETIALSSSESHPILRFKFQGGYWKILHPLRASESKFEIQIAFGTHPWNRVLVENLIVLARACRWSLPSVSWIHSTHTLRSMLILSPHLCLGHPICIFLSCVNTILPGLSNSAMRATYPPPTPPPSFV